jgi:hypothetical protein
MLNHHESARRAGALLFEMAAHRLDALLQEHGVSDPLDLPRDLAVELMRRALTETAALHSPTANFKAMDHGFRWLTHPAFAPAVDRVMSSIDQDQDAFAMAAGIDAAVVLAGFGLPIAPFDLGEKRIVGKPSNDIDTVLHLFGGLENALVGYSVCAAPFYVLLTDCVRTLHEWVPVEPALAQVKGLFAREGQTVSAESAVPFTPVMGLFRRRQGDKIRTASLIDNSANAGSIVLHAGWLKNGNPRGAPNEGYAPVPTPLLRAVVNDPLVGASYFLPGGARPTMH